MDQSFRLYVSQCHLAGFARLIGAEVNGYGVWDTKLNNGRPQLIQGKGVLSVVRLTPEKLLVSYSVDGRGRALIQQLYSPLWRVEDTGERAILPRIESSPDGLTELSLTPGKHKFALVFGGGWPERFGLMTTLTSMVIVVCGLTLFAKS